MKNIAILGVVVGGIVDIVLSTLTGIIFVAIWASSHSSEFSNLPKAQMADYVKNAIENNPMLYGTMFFLGSLCSIVGGYVAARIAKKSELLNGACAAWLCILIGIYGLFTGGHSPILTIITIPLSAALGAIGGWLRQRQTGKLLIL